MWKPLAPMYEHYRSHFTHSPLLKTPTTVKNCDYYTTLKPPQQLNNTNSYHRSYYFLDKTNYKKYFVHKKERSAVFQTLPLTHP